MVSEQLWRLHGFASEADFALLFEATSCSRCRKKLPKYARWRLRNRDGSWSKSIVCTRCKDLIDDRLGNAAASHLMLLQEPLFP